MPHVIAEAGAAGLPVVATCDNGTAEQITPGHNGLFVAHEAPAEVADALTLLVRDPALRQRLGRNLRRKVEAEYSAEVVTRRWETLFDELLQQERMHRGVSIPRHAGQTVMHRHTPLAAKVHP